MLLFQFHSPIVLSIFLNFQWEQLQDLNATSSLVLQFDRLLYIEFDFQDISVDIDETYYIIASCYCGFYDFPDNQCYAWCYDIDDVYPRGALWVKFEGIWTKGDYADFCFETYSSHVELPKIEIKSITGGFKVSAKVSNSGGTATNIDWSINLDGGFILMGGYSDGIIPSLQTGESETIPLDSLFGIGTTTITVVAGEETKQTGGE